MDKRLVTSATSLLAFLLATIISAMAIVYLAYRQGLEAEMDLVLFYAEDVQHRSDTTSKQIDKAIRTLVAAQSPDPCSESNITLMRQLDLTSSYIQAVAHVADDKILCSSFGMLEAIPIGPVDIANNNGVNIRINVTLPFDVDSSYLVIEKDGYAAVVHKNHAIDVTTDVNEVALALVSRGSSQVLAERGVIRPEWLALLGDRKQLITRRDGYVIAAVRSEQFLTMAVAVAPVASLYERVFSHLQILIPFVVGAGLLLLIMSLRLLHQRTELRKKTVDLGERVKELTLLHDAARMLQSQYPNDRQLLANIALLIPDSMQYPEVCEARIRYGDIDVSTSGWQETPLMLSCGFATDTGVGTIDVVYTQNQSTQDMAYLPEEYTVMSSLAKMLAAHFKRRQAEERITQLAYFERITGLPNRISLENRLDEALQAAQTDGHQVAVLLLSLSGFDDLTSTLGHRNGDDLLRYVADILGTRLNSRDLLASMGGNQFIILLPRLSGRHEIDLVIADVLERLKRPALIAGIQVRLDVSIGISIFPEHGESAELIMQHSEIALRAAKSNHRNYLLYSTAIDHYLPERIALVAELPDAIARGELVLHYQPKVDLLTGTTMGVEALVRWQHPQRGLIFPDQFIPLAERTQVINQMTLWVVTETLRQGRVWLDEGVDLILSINLSVRNLLDSELCETIPRLIEASGIPMDRVELEITEGAIMADPEQCKLLLNSMAERGVVFSMDDFGIGQSSLGYIKDLPIHKLKIDKSFVMGMQVPRNAAIVHGAIDLGHSLGMQVTAEGIEDESSCKALRAFGCDIGQGYYFARPQPADLLTIWLRESVWGYKKAD